MPTTRIAALACCSAVVLALHGAATGQAIQAARQTAAAPRAIQPADYGQWERLGRPVLSSDGRWMAYTVSRNDETRELRVRMLAVESEPTVIANAGRPGFSEDAQWLAYIIDHTDEEREKLTREKRPAHARLALRDLTTGEVEEIADVSSYVFSDDGAILLMRRSERRLLVRRLADGTDTAFGAVDEATFAPDASSLAMIVNVGDETPGNAVQLFDPATGYLRTLGTSDHRYTSLSWRDESDDLLTLERLTFADGDEETRGVVIWRGASADSTERAAWNPLEADEALARERRIVSARWADDGDVVFLSARPWESLPKALTPEKPDAKKEDSESGPARPERGAPETPKSLRETVEEPAGVEVWHVNDVDIVPRQKRMENRERGRSELIAWWPQEDRIVRLGGYDEDRIRVADGDRRALLFDGDAYDELRKFGPTLFDVDQIDIATGVRERVLEGVKFALNGSPDGRMLVFVRDGHVWLRDLDDDTERNLTATIPSHFTNQEMSNLTDEKPAYGVAGWSEDSGSIYLYDRFDIWRFELEGAVEPRRLTRGAEAGRRYRWVRLDFERERYIDPGAAMYLSVNEERTKRSGYARLLNGRATDLLMDDARISGLAKADGADVFAYTRERFDESPTILTTGSALADARPAASSNAQAERFLWGKSEVVTYESDGGDALEAALFYPADYDPAKSYPMIVYIYERLSQNLHRYVSPSELDPYNAAVFTAEGYFVLMPDIVYRPQNPGLSSAECVVPAVHAAHEHAPAIDTDHVGIIGHSWGAYQTAFLVTHTDTFAAGIAGAPLTNMMSMSMSIYWNSGQTDAWIFHESQGRMDRPFWKDVETYIRNSPIFGIEDLDAPLLVAFGDEDGAVDFNQGVEMYNAARLAGRPLVMLVYPGENHGLARKPNRLDYHYRVLEWFGHYLKGDAAPAWITEGEPWLEQKKRFETKD